MNLLREVKLFAFFHLWNLNTKLYVNNARMLFYDQMIKQLKELRKSNFCENLRGLIILNKRVIYIHSNFNKRAFGTKFIKTKKLFYICVICICMYANLIGPLNFTCSLLLVSKDRCYLK